MEARKIFQRIIIFLVSGHNVFSLTMQTKDVVTILHGENDIILNCTYKKDSKEDISNRKIRWQKLIDGKYEDIAMFSPPSGQEPFIVKNMQLLYNNRTYLIAPKTSLSVVMIIKDPVCSDEGRYRCWIEYYSDKSEKFQTSGSIVEFHAKASEPEEVLVFPKEIEENNSISLICAADVGSPRGYIHIWRVFQNSNKSKLIYKSNIINNKTENCTQYINVTTPYTVTSEDNGAVFRCSSQNNLTQGPGLSKYSQTISVLYGPDETIISLTPNKSMYNVGDRLTIQCITDSNPPSTINLYFRPNGTSVERPMGLTDNKLEFDSLQVTDSGTYTCTAVNEVGSNSPNATARVSVFVKRYDGCSQCRYIDACQQNNDKIECILNKWVPTAVVFMTLSVAFAVSSIVLCINVNRKRSQETIAVKTMHNTRPHPSDAPEDNGGGYASPSDLNRTQEHSLLLTHHNEPDGYTTTQEVVQYAAVQKSQQKIKCQMKTYKNLEIPNMNDVV